MSEWGLPALQDRRWRAVALVVILLGALVLRLWGINWDRDQHQHPDERYWSQVSAEIELPSTPVAYLDSDTSPANPYNHVDSWVYGTAPLLLTKATAGWLQAGVVDDQVPASVVARGLDAVGIDLIADDRATFDDGYQNHQVGRLLSALFDTATVAAVYLLARTMFGGATALLAAALQATVVLHIQYSHFLGAETYATFFATATVLGALALARGDRRTRVVVGTGLALGVAIAMKLNGVVLVPVVATAILVSPAPDHAASALTRWWPRVERLALVGIVSIAALRFALPYAFARSWSLELDPRWSDDLARLADVQSGSAFPPNVQWVDRTPLLYPLWQLVRFGLGLPLAIAAVAGIVAAMASRRDDRRIVALPLLLVASMLVLVATRRTPTMRYLLPMYPVLVVYAAFGIRRLWTSRLRPAAALLALAALAWGLVFTAGIYGAEHPRLEASRWLVENVRSGEAVSAQLWDDGLPLSLPELAGHGIESVVLDPFALDSRQSTLDLLDGLDSVDYVVESSNRLYDAIPRLPARYPATTAYYAALFDGRLGFEEVARFENRPSLFGLPLTSQSAEEAFSVYDHPTVTVWRKTDRYDRARAEAVVDPERADSAIAVTPGDGDENALMLRPDAYLANQAGGTFTDVFGDGGGASSTVPWLWWYLALQIASMVAVPWVSFVFAGVHGAGYGLAKPLGLLAWVLPVWLLVAYGVVDMSRGLVISWAVLLVLAGAVTAWSRRDQLHELAQRHRSSWVATEAVFAATYGALVSLRSANPDLWHPIRGGEKPMELAYLTAVTKSTTFPSYDPWFAGGSMNYFSFGYHMLAVPIRALRIVPEVAFNLGLATFAALAAASVFTLVASLGEGLGLRRRGRVLAVGVFGVLVMGLVGNLAALRQHAERLRAVNDWQGLADVPIVGSLFATVGGFWAWVTGTDLAPFDWWSPSRVNQGGLDITEFPAWSFVFGDLHPHVMGIVPLVLLVAIALAYLRAVHDQEPRHRLIILSLLAGVVTGVVRMVNTWDLPVAMIIAVAALVGAHALGGAPRRLRPLLRDLTAAVIAHFAVVAPYLDNGRVFDDGLQWTPTRTPVEGFAVQFGLFVIVASAYVVARAASRSESIRTTLERWSMTSRLLVGTGLASLLVAAATRGLVAVVAVTLTGLAFGLAWIEFRERSPVRAFVAGLLALGFAIIAGVDFVAVANDIERMNTVFKFWFQAWQLLALAAAVCAMDLVRELRRRRRTGRVAPEARVVSTLGFLALLGALVFVPLAVPPRIDDRFAPVSAGLDGLAYLEAGPRIDIGGVEVDLGADEPIINWLRREVTGSPTIVEAVGPSYQWPGRIASTTGLPTVVGWESHQIQQRRDFADAVARRRADTAAFWSATDTTSIVAYLRRYDVSYVVVGSWEAAMAQPATLELLDRIPALSVVYADGLYRVHAVDKWRLRGVDPGFGLGPLIHPQEPDVDVAAVTG